MSTDRIYLSSPHLSGKEQEYVKNAFDSNWIAPLGPHVDAFEAEMCAELRVGHAVALSSGTAALHLALINLDVKKGDEVICSSLTFAASANPITYVGALPVFIDSDCSTWTMDPNLLEEELTECRKRGKMPKAVICVDLYGQCADYRKIVDICRKYSVLLIEDAAEALGAECCDRRAGTFGEMGVLSFNGNKIITTSGGGMLVSNTEHYADRARFLASQARDKGDHYQHSEIGYNYRLSNILAAVGRGQLQNLESKVERKRAINRYYRQALAVIPGVEFMPEASYGRATFWLTCILIDPPEFGSTHMDLYRYLETHNIESRPIWKPMHMQPVFKDCRVRGGGISASFFAKGLCLPSGVGLTDGNLERVCSIITQYVKERS